MDRDGTQRGYELTLTRQVAELVSVPVIASGGAGHPHHLYVALTDGMASAVLVASIIKAYLHARGVAVRL